MDFICIKKHALCLNICKIWPDSSHCHVIGPFPVTPFGYAGKCRAASYLIHNAGEDINPLTTRLCFIEGWMSYTFLWSHWVAWWPPQTLSCGNLVQKQTCYNCQVLEYAVTKYTCPIHNWTEFLMAVCGLDGKVFTRGCTPMHVT